MASANQARRADIYDVAKLAGVSHQTVSRVINQRDGVREKTKSRVLDAMAQLDYRPNVLAQGLAGRRSRTIGVLTFDTRMYGPSSTLMAIEASGKQAGYRIAVATLKADDRHSVDEAISDLRSLRIDGAIVIAPTERTARAIDALPSEVPVVALEAEVREDVPTVAVDQVAGAYMATNHLIELGHETVWHVAGPQDWREAQLRVVGWREALATHDIPAPAVLQGDWSARSGYEAGRELAERSDVTAIFVANDHMALGVLYAMHEKGKRVPEDVSVVGFDDIPGSDFCIPPLTTIRQDFDEVGRRGLAELIAQIDGTSDGQLTRPITPSLVLRGSTAIFRGVR